MSQEVDQSTERNVKDSVNRCQPTNAERHSERATNAVPGRGHRIADAPNCSLDEVFHYESEFPAENDNDGTMMVIVRMDDEPEWWKSDEVSRVTTSAKRCSDAAP